MGTATTQLPETAEARAAVLRRLKRAQGQLNGVVGMIEQNRSCDEVVIQLAAVTKAVNTAAFTLLSEGLRECLDGPDSAASAARLQKLFLSLA